MFSGCSSFNEDFVAEWPAAGEHLFAEVPHDKDDDDYD
jgi:hypothetical protein